MWLHLTGKHDLHPTMKEIPRGSVSGTDWLRVQSGPASVKAGGKDATAVQYQQVAWAEQGGELNESSVFKPASRAREVQQAGAAAVRQGFLRDQLFWKVK